MKGSVERLCVSSGCHVENVISRLLSILWERFWLNLASKFWTGLAVLSRCDGGRSNDNRSITQESKKRHSPVFKKILALAIVHSSVVGKFAQILVGRRGSHRHDVCGL